MKLTKQVFKIHAKKVSARIEKFIKEKMKEFKREGIVVPISGGLDSSVIAALCVGAVGKDKVIGLILPEKQGNPEAEIYAKKIADFLKIKTKKFDISNTLDSLGTYSFILSYIPSQKLREKVVKKFLALGKENPFVKGIKGTKSKLISKGLSKIYIKQRIRMVLLYRFAEENNLLVVGSAHKSEDLTGLFVKFGVDDAADLMPLKNLYRSQILQIAKFLKIPQEIINRTPNPDVIPGVKDKYFDVLNLNSEKIDLILYGLEKNMPCKQIAKQLELKEDKVREIKKLKELTYHMRNPSLAPKF